LLEADLIHLVASDAHDDQNRTQVLSKAYQKIVDRYGLERGTRLFSITPQKIVRGEPVTLQTPVSLEQVRLQNKKSPLNLRKWLNRMVQTK
jgi:tyrosine-protein phosphatase YwqE